jgi:hypothetical protein
MYQITRACTKGDLENCKCIESLNSRSSSLDKVNDGGKQEWSGCSDNVLFGYRLSKSFVDSSELYDSLSRRVRILDTEADASRPSALRRNEYRLMNLHNNEVGRRVILKNMKQLCKCHGVSGSCSLKICWKVMPDFRLIGDELMIRYRMAEQIREKRTGERYRKLKMIATRRSTSNNNGLAEPHKMITNYKDELIYIDKSPNFCRRNRRIGSLGTNGRMCSVLDEGITATIATLAAQSRSRNVTWLNLEHEKLRAAQHCDYLCCGRGYHTRQTEIEEDCDCQFQWCCSVKCKKCKRRIVQYFCN